MVSKLVLILPWIKELPVLAEKGFVRFGRLVRALSFVANEGRAAFSMG